LGLVATPILERLIPKEEAQYPEVPGKADQALDQPLRPGGKHRRQHLPRSQVAGAPDGYSLAGGEQVVVRPFPGDERVVGIGGGRGCTGCGQAQDEKRTRWPFDPGRLSSHADTVPPRATGGLDYLSTTIMTFIARSRLASMYS